MPDLDPELLERAVRWCADAGRHVGIAEVRRALAPLGWDELLAVRALLADPPPARPLGPHALADLARGAPADVAAEREREGRYASEAGAGEPDAGAPPEPGAAATPGSTPARRRRGGRRGAGVVIRRARDRASPAPAAAAPLPALDELRRPEGRAVLERLVRGHGARRAPILAALAAGWAGPGGGAPGDAELSALLDQHGLARAFERRERDELLHVLRAAGGVRTTAAERLGLDADGLARALARLGATEQAERIREDRRAELRARATLAERVRLLLSDEARLRDLELLREFEDDLRARLPELVRALRAAGQPVANALGHSLSVGRPDAEALAVRFGLELGAAAVPHRPRAPSAGGKAPQRSPRRRGTGARPAPAARAGERGRPGRGESRPRPAARGAPARRSAPGTPGPRRSGPRRSGPPASGRGGRGGRGGPRGPRRG